MKKRQKTKDITKDHGIYEALSIFDLCVFSVGGDQCGTDTLCSDSDRTRCGLHYIKRKC